MVIDLWRGDCFGAARAHRARFFERRSRIRISYPDGREVQVPRSFSVLEASRFARHPPCFGLRRPRPLLDLPDSGHLAAVELPLPSAGEQKVLQRVGARAECAPGLPTAAGG